MSPYRLLPPRHGEGTWEPRGHMCAVAGAWTGWVVVALTGELS
jgi:hypothetical protein